RRVIRFRGVGSVRLGVVGVCGLVAGRFAAATVAVWLAACGPVASGARAAIAHLCGSGRSDVGRLAAIRITIALASGQLEDDLLGAGLPQHDRIIFLE